VSSPAIGAEAKEAIPLVLASSAIHTWLRRTMVDSYKIKIQTKPTWSYTNLEVNRISCTFKRLKLCEFDLEIPKKQLQQNGMP